MLEILLPVLQGKVKKCYEREVNSQRKAKLAYVDTVAKPPRNVARAQVSFPCKRKTEPNRIV